MFINALGKIEGHKKNSEAFRSTYKNMKRKTRGLTIYLGMDTVQTRQDRYSVEMMGTNTTLLGTPWHQTMDPWAPTIFHGGKIVDPLF